MDGESARFKLGSRPYLLDAPSHFALCGTLPTRSLCVCPFVYLFWPNRRPPLSQQSSQPTFSGS